MGAPVSIIVIDTHYCSREGGDFAEAYQQAFVDLALWGYKYPTEQEH